MVLSESAFGSASFSRRGSTPDDRTIVWLNGEHDLTTKAAVAATIASAARRTDGDLLVDLSEVTFMDASTIGALIAEHNRLWARSRSLLLRAPPPPAARVLDLCGLAHLVHRAGAEPRGPAGEAAAPGADDDVFSAIPSLRAKFAPAASFERAEPAGPPDLGGAPPSSISPTIEADRGGP